MSHLNNTNSDRQYSHSEDLRDDGATRGTHRHPGRASGVVPTPPRRARSARTPVGEDRPLEPPVRSPRSARAVLGHRQPDEPHVPHAWPQGRPLLRRGAPRPLRVPRDPRRESRRRLPLREVQGPPAGALRARGRAVSPEPGREPPDPGPGGPGRSPPAGGRQAEHRRIGCRHRAGGLEGAARIGARSPGPWSGRHGARAGVRRADWGRDRPRRGAGRRVPLRDPHRARRRGRVQPLPGRHLPDAGGRVPAGRRARRVG
jgi:hypothetical protein